MKKIITLVLFLAIVSAVSGVLLGYVNGITEPLIKEAQIAKEKANLEKMYPGGSFESTGEKLVDGKTILGIYKVEGKGYAFKLWAKGYASSGITILAGFDFDGNITKVVALEQQETAGFGSKVFDKIDEMYTDTKADEDIDMLAGATVTSTAMKNMLEAARAVFPELG